MHRYIMGVRGLFVAEMMSRLLPIIWSTVESVILRNNPSDSFRKKTQ